MDNPVLEYVRDPMIRLEAEPNAGNRQGTGTIGLSGHIFVPERTDPVARLRPSGIAQGRGAVPIPNPLALLSVHDKTGLVAFAAGLCDLGFDLVSTGGTARTLTEAGLAVLAVSDLTGFPEILDGRVKTLHPAVHAALLARRDDPAHLAEIDRQGIRPIALVAANLYPFAETVHDPTVALADALEQIDIGGPAMIRAAAKNHPGVLIVTDGADYAPVLAALAAGDVSARDRRALAAKAFAHVAAYDAIVADYLRRDPAAETTVTAASGFPDEFAIAGRKTRDLRYGENPHQAAAAYRRLGAGPQPAGVLDALQIGGKELSFNNLLDADAALAAIAGFAEPAVAIVKHTIPCGLAVRPTLAAAFAAALAGDPVSAFGGIVALNRLVDGATADALAEIFFEVVIAPAFSPEARAVLERKRSLRLLELDLADTAHATRPGPWDVRPIQGGLLIQEPDTAADDPKGWAVVSQRPPTAAEWADLTFAWTAIRRVPSNAIVLVRDRAVIGVGSGQPNRLESVRIAAAKAGDRAAGAVLASDAFFPFRDGVDAAVAAGVAAIVQPGGSVRDAEVLTAVEGAGAAMLITARRHFRH